MAPSQTHVTIDGVTMPVAQAMEGVNAGLDASAELVNHLQDALAQPVGDAVQASADGCSYLKKTLKKYLRALSKATQGTADALINPLVDYVGQSLSDSSALQSTLATAVAGVPSVPPTGMPLPAPRLSTATLAAAAAPNPLDGPQDALCKPGSHVLYNGPYGPLSRMSPCGRVGIRYQCVGSDGKPAASAFVILDTGSSGPIGIIGNYDPFGAAEAGPVVNTGNWDDIVATVNADFPNWVKATCGGAPIPSPTPTGTWNIYYYCDPCADPAGVHNWHAQVAPSNPGNPWILFSGAGVNFPSQPAAQAALDSASPLLDAACQYAPGSNANCGPVPSPPAPPSPPQPQPQPGGMCETPPTVCSSSTTSIDVPCQGSQLPDIFRIGTPEFCQAKDTLRASLIDLGKWVVSKVGDIDLSAPLGTGLTIPRDPTFGWVSDLANFTELLQSQSDKQDGKGIVESLRKVINCWWSVISGQQGCNLGEVAFLSVVKAFLEILQRFRVGWDAVLWATSDITVHIPPLIAVLDYLIADACPAEIPHPPEAIDCYMKSTAPADQVACWLSCRGWSWDVIWPVIYARRERVTDRELINISRRVGLDDDSINALLRRYGYLTEEDAADRLTAYDQLPNVADVLHFLQRNVFDDDYVRDYGLLDGFTERFWPRYGTGLRALGVLESTARDHYAAHWINPSIGQLAEMAQRLRPGRVPDAVAFKWTDFLRVLAEQDVAPFFRERLQSISYRPISIRQLTLLAVSRAFDEAELAERWQDIGYAPKDATALARSLMQQAARQRATQQKGYTPAVVAKLWPAGQITRAEAIAALAPQGMTAADVDTLLEVSSREQTAALYQKHTVASIQAYAALATKAYADGVVERSAAVAALERAGYSAAAASLEIDTVELQRKMQRIADARKAIKKSLLRGEINASEATAALLLVGVQPDAAADYVAVWSLELTIPRKSLVVGQIKKLATEGLLSLAAAETRFLNLGYPAGDAALMIAEISAIIRDAELKSEARSAKDLAAASARAAAASAKIAKSYCKLYSPGKLKLWFAERIIDESNLRDKLTKCGYDADAADNFVKEAHVARDKRDEQAAKKGATGIEYAGPGAVTS